MSALKEPLARLKKKKKDVNMLKETNTKKKLYNRYCKHSFKALNRAIFEYKQTHAVDTKEDLIDSLRNKIWKLSKGKGWKQYAVFYEEGELYYKIMEDTLIDIFVAWNYIYIKVNSNLYKLDLNDYFKIMRLLELINKYYNK